MTAHVLVVDDLLPNVKLLEAKLRAEYFEVSTASSGAEAIKIAHERQPDIILLDVMMPGMDGFETCEKLKADNDTCHIPVVMVTALDQQEDRIAGLEAGADDFLTKPVEDVALFARVRGLTRLKMMTDELRLGHATGKELGILTNAKLAEFDSVTSEILVIDDTKSTNADLFGGLPDNYNVTHKSDTKAALSVLRTQKVDLVIVNMSLEEYDPLRLCSTIRTLPETRMTPLLALVRQGDTRKLVRSLDVGVNDYLTRPVDKGEMAARIRTQLRRKHYIDQLRTSFQVGLELAVTDQLTGLYNRRYLVTHTDAIFADPNTDQKPISILVIDVDHFKPINDTYGHEAGDLVLQELAKRIVSSVRGIDVACRYGGEEFVLLMPSTDSELASMIAERLREDIEEHPIVVDEETQKAISLTVSIGIATSDVGDNDTAQKMLKRADDALYQAKNQGRNQVVFAA
jgi:two-component system cell cycle response regulator